MTLSTADCDTLRAQAERWRDDLARIVTLDDEAAGQLDEQRRIVGVILALLDTVDALRGDA